MRAGSRPSRERQSVLDTWPGGLDQSAPDAQILCPFQSQHSRTLHSSLVTGPATGYKSILVLS